MNRDDLVAAARAELLDSAAVAKLLGLRPSTLRSYLAREQMPPPDLRFGQSPVWHRRTVEDWRQSPSRTPTDT